MFLLMCLWFAEINPTLQHLYVANFNFTRLIMNNIDGKENQSIIGQYDEDIIMMMYDDVVIKSKSELLSDKFDLL